MKDALLAVRVDSKTLEKFRAKCAELKIKQSEVITDFLNDFLEGKKKPSSQDVAITPEVLDNRITERITEYLDSKLDNRITERLTEYLDSQLGQGATDNESIAPKNGLRIEQLENKGTITPETENKGLRSDKAKNDFLQLLTASFDVGQEIKGKENLATLKEILSKLIGRKIDHLSRVAKGTEEKFKPPIWVWEYIKVTPKGNRWAWTRIK